MVQHQVSQLDPEIPHWLRWEGDDFLLESQPVVRGRPRGQHTLIDRKHAITITLRPVLLDVLQDARIRIAQAARAFLPFWLSWRSPRLTDFAWCLSIASAIVRSGLAWLQSWTLNFSRTPLPQESDGCADGIKKDIKGGKTNSRHLHSLFDEIELLIQNGR